MPVVAYSKQTDFPAFFGAKSGFQVCRLPPLSTARNETFVKVPWNSDDPRTIAEILRK